MRRSARSHALQRGLVAIALVAIILSLTFMAIVAKAECPQAVAEGESAVRYAQEAFGYLYVNQSYLERLYQLMINASYSGNSSCQQVASEMAGLASQGPYMVARARLYFYALIAGVSSSVAFLGVGAWLCVGRCRRLAWRAWLAAHRKWVVSRTGSQAPVRAYQGDADPDRYPLYVAGLLVIIAVGLAGVTAFEIFWRPGPFSVIALLNPQGLLGDYPTSVPPGSNVSLMVLIIDHMNEPMLYRVSAAVVNVTAPPAPSSLSGSMENVTVYVVVGPGRNATAPLVFTAPASPGQYKLLVLLYYYNATAGSYYYSGLFNQLYFNVTA